jgi:hypothetical protein
VTCSFHLEDAAYVLGALSPTERLDFERHLAGCPHCTRAVRELAGLPGLLGRVDASVLESSPETEPVPVPDTLLPSLSREVRRSRRQRTFAVAGLAAAVTAVVAVAVPVAISQAGDDNAAAPNGTTSGTTPAGPTSRPMTPVGDVPVQASVALEPVTWGTKLVLDCTYQPSSVEYSLPPAVDYTLVVRTRGGRTEQVGSWRSVRGTTMRVTAATSVNRAAIASVEVRTSDGRVVLRLAA